MGILKDRINEINESNSYRIDTSRKDSFELINRATILPLKYVLNTQEDWAREQKYKGLDALLKDLDALGNKGTVDIFRENVPNILKVLEKHFKKYNIPFGAKSTELYGITDKFLVIELEGSKEVTNKGKNWHGKSIKNYNLFVPLKVI